MAKDEVNNLEFQLLILNPNDKKKAKRPIYPNNKEGATKAAKIIKIFNGQRGLYRSVYNYRGKVDGQNALIDKIYLDFDPDEENGEDYSLEYAQRTSDYLAAKDIRHATYFSGRGFHIYVYTHPVFAYELNNGSDAIHNFVAEMKEDIDIKPDQHVIGDLRRVSRIKNTKNLKTELYCIPISRETLLNSTKEKIEEMAQEPVYDKFIYGNGLIDLRKYDTDKRKIGMSIEYDKEVSLLFSPVAVPKCVQVALDRGDPGYQERYMIITALRDLAYSEGDVTKILEEHLIEEKFCHCVEEEGQVDYLFAKQHLLFPSCDTIKTNGYCIKGCSGQCIYY